MGIFFIVVSAHAPAAVVAHSTIAHHPISPLGYHGGIGYPYGGYPYGGNLFIFLFISLLICSTLFTSNVMLFHLYVFAYLPLKCNTYQIAIAILCNKKINKIKSNPESRTK